MQKDNTLTQSKGVCLALPPVRLAIHNRNALPVTKMDFIQRVETVFLNVEIILLSGKNNVILEILGTEMAVRHHAGYKRVGLVIIMAVLKHILHQHLQLHQLLQLHQIHQLQPQTTV